MVFQLGRQSLERKLKQSVTKLLPKERKQLSQGLQINARVTLSVVLTNLSLLKVGVNLLAEKVEAVLVESHLDHHLGLLVVEEVTYVLKEIYVLWKIL